MRIVGLSLGALLLAGSAAIAAPTETPAPPAAQTAAPAAAAPAATPATTPAPAPAPAVTPIPGGAIFISPMGEPFRGANGLSGAEVWFRQTDANHDDKITLDEFKADAMRFFASLDVDHDGEIGPDEIERYETVVAPEIRVMSTYGDPSLAKQDDDGNITPPPYPTRLGAGRYSFLDMPEPVVSADTNFDRAVSKQEFLQAAITRFKMLDANGDGVLTRDELPRLDTHQGRSGKHHGGGGSGGGSHGGGHHGGGMGAGGGMGMGGMGGAGMNPGGY